MNTLTANEIAVLSLVYVGHPLPMDPNTGTEYKVWVSNALRDLTTKGMVREAADGSLEPSPKGTVYMEHLTTLPLPSQVWSMK